MAELAISQFVQERYVCIEPGYVKEFKTLQPGEQWTGQQVLKVKKD